MRKLFLFMFAISYFYAACGIDDVSRVSLLGSKVHATFGLGYRLIASQKVCFVSDFCLQPKSMTLAAAGAMRCRQPPDGGIQWLQVKPGMCSIGQCIPHCTTASAWPLKLPAICLYFLLLSFSLLATILANDHVMVHIN